jgi:hypothetical protein
VTDTWNRHLDTAGFERCLATGVPVEFPIDGRPKVFLFINPGRPAIGLRIPDDGSRPETSLEHLDVRTVYHDEARWLEVLITDPGLFLEGYPFLCSVADRVQLQGMSADSAVAETVRVLGRLLTRIDGMSVERELGLLGELLMLRGLCRTVGIDKAIAAWCGPESEEHDFALHGLDLEVKTTQSERRAHWISSLTQLESTPGRPLWLVSYQLTRTGPDAGITLPACIDSIYSVIGRGGPRDSFDRRLEHTGWRESQARATRARWLLRSSPGAYRVDAHFPRLTARTLTDSHITMTHIPDVRYRIDLSGLEPSRKTPDFLAPVLTLEV